MEFPIPSLLFTLLFLCTNSRLGGFPISRDRSTFLHRNNSLSVLSSRFRRVSPPRSKLAHFPPLPHENRTFGQSTAPFHNLRSSSPERSKFIDQKEALITSNRRHGSGIHPTGNHTVHWLLQGSHRWTRVPHQYARLAERVVLDFTTWTNSVRSLLRWLLTTDSAHLLQPPRWVFFC